MTKRSRCASMTALRAITKSPVNFVIEAAPAAKSFVIGRRCRCRLHGDRCAAPHGLSSARWQVLGAIAMAPQPLNVPQIAAAMGITRQGALKQTRLLVAEKMVRLQPNPAHRRSPLHLLTPEGQAAYDAVVGRWPAHARAMARQFDAEELETGDRCARSGRAVAKLRRRRARRECRSIIPLLNRKEM